MLHEKKIGDFRIRNHFPFRKTTATAAGEKKGGNNAVSNRFASRTFANPTELRPTNWGLANEQKKHDNVP
jgi:hypothetical protein